MARTAQEAEPPHTASPEAPAAEPPSEGELAGEPDADSRSPRLTWVQRRRGRQYTTGEEIANSVSHGIGACLSVAGLVLLIVFSVMHGGGLRLLSGIVFGVSLLLEYLFSTLYHAIQPPRAKRVLRVFDHCSIYVLIAGTYTPFCLVTLYGQGGLAMCCVIWAVSVAGIAVETFSRERQPKWVSALIYLVLGWAVVFKLPALAAALPGPGMWLLLAGGLSYTVGCVFYLLKKVPYMHMVWHLFVLGGSICHFLAVLLYVV
ncbi:MAG: hemolysin III family protein [Coriobacteriales bacterium]|jgi:hemolysin III